MHGIKQNNISGSAASVLILKNDYSVESSFYAKNFTLHCQNMKTTIIQLPGVSHDSSGTLKK